MARVPLAGTDWIPGPMSDHAADVVIVGGGIEGAAAAWALTQRGVTDVVVAERNTVGSGMTGKSSGIVRCHYGVSSLAAMATVGLEVFEKAEEIFGDDIGFRQTGYVVGVGEPNVESLRKSLAAQRAVGVQTEEIDAARWPGCGRSPTCRRSQRSGGRRAAATATPTRRRRPSPSRRAPPVCESARAPSDRPSHRRRQGHRCAAGRRNRDLGGHGRGGHRCLDAAVPRAVRHRCPDPGGPRADRDDRPRRRNRPGASLLRSRVAAVHPPGTRRRGAVRQQRPVRRLGGRPRRLPQPRHRRVRRPHRRQGRHPIPRIHRCGDQQQLRRLLRRRRRTGTR